MARIYPVNTGDKGRMKMLCDPTWPAESGKTGAGVEAGSPVPLISLALPGDEDSAGAGEVNPSQVNIAQTNSAVNDAFIRLLVKYPRVYQAKPKVVTSNRTKMQLPLVSSSCTPHAANQ